jgi:hypothetical protein
MKPIGATLLMLCVFFFASSEAKETDTLRFDDRIYDSQLRTPLLEPENEPQGEPIYRLGSAQKLILRFDLLEDETRELAYRVVHCDPDWKPSVISEYEYLSGFTTDRITDVRHSLNTVTAYWHYTLKFPNEQISPSLSGNYVLIVYHVQAEDDILLTRRFRIVEPLTEITANVHRATGIDIRNSHQEVDFNVNLGSLRVTQPFQEIRVDLVQNGDASRSIKGLRPLIANGAVLNYDLDEGNTFEGGCEYRPLDLRTSRFLTANIERIDPTDGYHPPVSHLKPDGRTASQRHSARNDLNGRFSVLTYDGRDPHLEGDYTLVEFLFKTSDLYFSHPVYLQGGFTDFRTDSETRLDFDSDSIRFTKKILLKQGYYDYRYVTVSPEGTVSALETEGSHYETRNRYDIFVYWLAPGSRYARLVGHCRADAGGF